MEIRTTVQPPVQTPPIYLSVLNLVSILILISPGQALGQSSSPMRGSLSSRTGSVTVFIPGHGHYALSSDLLSPWLNPAAATNDDLLAAAAFSADYESNMPVRTAALQSLSSDTRARVTAALAAFHAPATPTSSLPSPVELISRSLSWAMDSALMDQYTQIWRTGSTSP